MSVFMADDVHMTKNKDRLVDFGWFAMKTSVSISSGCAVTGLSAVDP
jgi:hypothetical protein